MFISAINVLTVKQLLAQVIYNNSIIWKNTKPEVDSFSDSYT